MADTNNLDPSKDPNADAEAKKIADAEAKKIADAEAKKIADAEAKASTKTKEVTLPCKYAQVRIGTEYFTPDHEGNITVPAELAKEAKKVCGE